MSLRELATGVRRSLFHPSLRGVFAATALPRNTSVACDGVHFLDLLRAPTKTISLQRFISMRHQWCADSFFTFAKHGDESHEYSLLLPADRVVTVSEDAPRDGGRGKSFCTTHLFEINDAFRWDLPPVDDLASPAYWKQFKKQMEQYANQLVNEKANVELRMVKGNAPGTRSAVAMIGALRNIQEGDELVMHYGREWWTTILLRNIFMSAADEHLKDLRWIESIFYDVNDRSEPFPHILVKNDSQKKKVLFDATTKRKATNEAALVFALRRSAQSEPFLKRLMTAECFGRSGLSPVDEIPLRTLRRCLLMDLTGEAVREGEHGMADVASDDALIL